MKVISVGFLSPGDKPLVWRGPMLHSIIKQFIGQVEWGQLDYLIVDLPPGTRRCRHFAGAEPCRSPARSWLHAQRRVASGRTQGYRDVQAGEGRHPRNRREHELLRLSSLPPGSRHLLEGGRPAPAAQFSVPFLGSIELDPDIRKGGDSGQPIVLEGDQSPHAKSMFAFTHRVIERTKEVQASAGGSVIQIT